MILLRAYVMLLVLGAGATAHAIDLSRPADNTCLDAHSMAWCLMATRGFGNQFTDVRKRSLKDSLAEPGAVCRERADQSAVGVRRHGSSAS